MQQKHTWSTEHYPFPWKLVSKDTPFPDLLCRACFLFLFLRQAKLTKKPVQSPNFPNQRHPHKNANICIEAGHTCLLYILLCMLCFITICSLVFFFSKNFELTEEILQDLYKNPYYLKPLIWFTSLLSQVQLKVKQLFQGHTTR